MFGHDDKPDEDQREDAHAADNNPVIDPVNGSDDSSWQHPGPPPTDDGNDHQDSPAKTFTPGYDDGSNQPEQPGQSYQPPSDQPDQPGAPDPAAIQPADAAGTDAPLSAPVTSSNFGAAASGSNDDLIDLKQEALGKLSPLIGHLDQSPEEKFRTLMMMIQASDDQSLIRQAYETAQQIDSEKTRAQALLDIVNEVNYFTQNPKPE